MGWSRHLVHRHFRPYVTPREAFWGMAGATLVGALTVFVIASVTTWAQYWWWWVLLVLAAAATGPYSALWMVRRARSRMRHESL